MKIKEDKTTITEFHFKLTLGSLPENWVSLSPVKIFGIFIGHKLKLAKPNYKWTK